MKNWGVTLFHSFKSLLTPDTKQVFYFIRFLTCNNLSVTFFSVIKTELQFTYCAVLEAVAENTTWVNACI